MKDEQYEETEMETSVSTMVPQADITGPMPIISLQRLLSGADPGICVRALSSLLSPPLPFPPFPSP